MLVNIQYAIALCIAFNHTKFNNSPQAIEVLAGNCIATIGELCLERPTATALPVKKTFCWTVGLCGERNITCHIALTTFMMWHQKKLNDTITDLYSEVMFIVH